MQKFLGFGIPAEQAVGVFGVLLSLIALVIGVFIPTPESSSAQSNAGAGTTTTITAPPTTETVTPTSTQEPTTVTTTATTEIPVTVTETVEAGDKQACYSNATHTDRESLVADSLQRRGGTIGTGGKAAVALRFDHYLGHFETKVLPLLEKYNLPWSQAINAANIGTPKDPWSWEKLQSEAVKTGGEVWNHSLTHQDFDEPDAAYREVVVGLRSLQNNLPLLHVDGWIAPGLRKAMGMQWPSNMNKFTDTFPGQMVLDNHAFVRASFPGHYQTLDGDQLIGQNHFGIEDKNFEQIKKEIDHVMQTGEGLTLMMHPWRVGTSQGISNEDLEQTFAYLAELRDTDRIEIASGSGILMADSSVDEHHGNLLATNEAGRLEGVVQEKVALDCRRLGVTYEAEVWVQGTGTYRLELDVGSQDSPLALNVEGGATEEKKRISIPVTVPKDAHHITLRLSGYGEYSGLAFQPI